MNKSRHELAYLQAVASIPCVLCAALGQAPQDAEVHHLRAGHGMGQRASHYLTAAVCPEHHRGPRGIHGDRSALRLAKLQEIDLHALTVAAVFINSMSPT